jgi:hypothetical protein
VLVASLGKKCETPSKKTTSTQGVERLLCKGEPLSSNPSPTQEKEIVLQK